MKKRTLWVLLALIPLILFCAAGDGSPINGMNEEYVIGDTITILIENSKEPSITATLEQNEFELDKENINFKRSFVATSSGTGKKKNWTLKIDTTDVPEGTYNIIIYGENRTIATAKVKLVHEKTITEKLEDNSAVIPEIPVIDDEKSVPTSPGFNLLPLIGGLLFPVILRNKKK